MQNENKNKTNQQTKNRPSFYKFHFKSIPAICNITDNRKEFQSLDMT